VPVPAEEQFAGNRSKAMKRWSWLLAIALGITTLAIIGCSGDDEDGTPTTTTVVVTNTVGGVTRTNIVVVTNAPVDDPAADDTVHPPIVVAGLAAPELIEPSNGQVYETMVIAVGVSVKFKWAAVAGADTYVLELDGALINTDGTSRLETLALGTHTWSVRAKKNGALLSGPASEMRTVTIKQKLLMPGI
jgi:hypothetical protein